MVRGFWLVVGMLSIACGGVVARHSGDDDDDDDDSTSGGSSPHSTGGSTSVPKGGSASTTPGGATSTPTAGSASVPPVNYGEGQGCYNDDDCPNPACGGLVCNWNKLSQSPSGMKIFYCNNAGSAPKGVEGWCTTNADCKCAGLGATCVNTHCTFTRPTDGPR
jgi:hypothetical protein